MKKLAAVAALAAGIAALVAVQVTGNATAGPKAASGTIPELADRLALAIDDPDGPIPRIAVLAVRHREQSLVRREEASARVNVAFASCWVLGRRVHRAGGWRVAGHQRFPPTARSRLRRSRISGTGSSLRKARPARSCGTWPIIWAPSAIW